jgi:hypothetical protein
LSGEDSALDAWLREARDAARRAALAASASTTAAWERQHALDVDAALDWIDQLRALFGDPATDRRPWAGDDFRL